MAEPSTLPIELVEILTRINDNIYEVKERLARLEAQDHSDSIKSIRAEIDKERSERINLQIEMVNVKTKLAPIIVGISLAAAALLEVLLKTL